MASKKYGLNPGCWAKHIGRDAQGAFFWDRMRVREHQVIEAELSHVPECCEGVGCWYCTPPCPEGLHVPEGIPGDPWSWTCSLCGEDLEEPSPLALLAAELEEEPSLRDLLRN